MARRGSRRLQYCFSWTNLDNIASNVRFFQPLEAVEPYKDDSYVFPLSEPAVLAALKQLNPRNAAGPDCVSNWLLCEYAEVLV